MKETIAEKYALSVCFVFLICLVVALGIGIYDIIEIVNIESTIHACDNAAQSLTKAAIIVLLNLYTPLLTTAGKPFCFVVCHSCESRNPVFMFLDSASTDCVAIMEVPIMSF